MKPYSTLHLRRLLLITTATGAACASHLVAANGADTWTGATSSTWNASNWTGVNNPPISGDSLTFTSATGSGGTTLTDNLMTASTYTLTGITFNAGAAAFTINPATAGTNGFTLSGGITNSGTNLETINDNIALTGASHALAMTTGGGNVTLGGSISGGGAIATAGAGVTLTLSGNNTSWTGFTEVTNNGPSLPTDLVITSGQTVVAASNTALGAGAVGFNGTGTLTWNGGTTPINNTFVIGNATGATFNGGTLNVGSSGLLVWGGATNIVTTINNTLNFAGNVHMNDTSTTARTVTYAGSGAINFSGVVSNGSGSNGTNAAANGMQYEGTGSLTVSGLNTYTGSTLVEQGSLIAGANAPSGSAGAFGNSTGTISIGSTTAQNFTGAASILTNTGGITIARGITESATVSNTGGLFIGGNQTSGTSTYTGTITMGAAPLTLTSAPGGTVNFNDVIAGAQNITIGGGGTVMLTGANTFSGGTITIASGSTLNTINNGTNLGAAANILAFNNGIYQFTAGSGGFDLSNARTLAFLSGGGTIDTNGNNVTFASAVGNGGTGSFTGGLTLADSNATPGSLTLGAANNYTGTTTVTRGTLVTSVANALGTSGSNGLAVKTNGNLDLHGTNQNVGNLTGTGGNIYNSQGGTSTLTIGNANTGGGSFAGVIENNTGSGGTMALTKTGTGTISLTGASTYTGATTINQGVLNVGGAGSLGGTAVTVNNGGTLSIGLNGSTLTTVIGTSGAASLTVNSGGTLSFSNGIIGSADTAIKNLDLNSSTGGTALTLNGGTINIGVGGAGGSDMIVLGTGASLITSLTGTTTINLNVVTALNGSAQELIAWGTGGTTGAGTFALGTVNGLGPNGYSLTLMSNSTGLFLEESQTSNAYWKGGAGTSWSTISNFTTDAGGTNPRSAALDNQTSVVFVASGGANDANTTLDGSYTINTLTYNVGGVGIGSGSGGTLTINGATGITVNPGLGATTENISANIALGGSQTWTVSDAASTLAVSGNISGTGFGLVKAGSGTLALSGVNSYSGATTVSAGYLDMESSDALDGTSGVTVNSGAALQMQGGVTTNNSTNLAINGNGPSGNGALESLTDGNSYTGSISLGSASSIGSDAGLFQLTGTAITNNGYTLTLLGAGNGYISNVISGSGGLTMSGTGMWTLDGANTYTGTTTVNSGTLQLGNSGNGTFGAATNTLAMNGGTVDINGYPLTIGNLTGSSGTITNNYPFEAALMLGSNTNSSFGGTITNGASGSGILDLIKQGSGTQTLTGSNSYTGPTTVQAGALRIAAAKALSAGSNATVNSGAALQLSGGITTAASSLSLTGSGIGSAGALENVSGTNTYTGPVSLAGATSIGSDAGLLTLGTNTITGSGSNLTLVGAGNGSISDSIATGAGNLTMNGTGTWTLSGNNTYTGSTSVTNGTLVYTAASVLANTSAINIGSGTTTALDYAGSGETVSKALNLSGTGSITLGNIGSGSITYSAAPAFAANNITLVLGNATDTIGGTIGNITNGATGSTTLVKQGLTNSTWVLTGNNTYTGPTTINGGVLQVASASALPAGNLVLSGTSTATLAVLQTNGTLNLTTGTNLTWGVNAGFSAIGGNLNLNINSGGQLAWGTNFSGGGGALAVFGSSTSNGQVILPNNINLNTSDAFQQNVYVAKGAGGDSTLLSGMMTNGTGTLAASGINKIGGGTLILTNGNSSYSGATSIVGGTLVAEASSTITVANSTSTSTGVFGSGFGPVGAGTGAAGTGSAATYAPIVMGQAVTAGGSTFGGVINPTLMVGSPTVGGSTSISNPVNVDWNNGTGQVYGIGGYTDSNNTFAGPITLSGTAGTGNTFAVTQVATTGADSLNITGGITAAGAGGNINFANIGAVNVSTTPISNGTGTISVTQSGSGTTTFSAANTYTGPTTVNGGLLRINGSLVAASAVTVNSGGAIGGTGTINGSLTVNGGGAINLADGTIGTLTVGSLTLGTGSTALTFDIGAGSSNNLDSIANLGTLTTNGTSAITIGFVNGTPTLTPGTYTLISGAITLAEFNTFSLTDTQLGFYAFTLVDGGASGLELQVVSNAPATTYYYTGATSTDFTDYHNYNTGASNGTPQSVALSSTSDVTIGTTSPAPGNLTPVANSNVSINSLTFAPSGAGATLSGTGTVSISAGSGIGITDNAGGMTTETISAPIALIANQKWAVTNSGNTLNVSGPIGGARSLLLSGMGKFKLAAANTFSGGLTVGTGSDTPTLLLANGSNGSATGVGSLTINTGATLGGAGAGLTGTALATSFQINGNVIVGNGTDATSSLKIAAPASGTVDGTISGASLTFNLNSANANANLLDLGSTNITFSSTTLTLNMLSTSVVTPGRSYTLITDAAGFNASTDGLTTTMVGGKLVITGGLSIANSTYFGASVNGFTTGQYPGSFLYISGDNIDVEVVPEPGTWALILSGLAMLLLWQRRRNRQS